jgi:hypothetical protein
MGLGEGLLVLALLMQRLIAAFASGSLCGPAGDSAAVE